MQKASSKLIVSTLEIDGEAKARLLDSLPSDWEYVTYDEGANLEKAEVLLLSPKFVLTGERLAAMKNLRLIQSFSAGVDHLDFGIIPPDITVCANAGAFADPIAEFVLGAVISLGRNLEQHDKELRNGMFVQSPPGMFLKGKTIGVIGTGGIGQSVARIAKALGMVTFGVNTSGHPAPYFDRVSSLAGGLHSLLRESDIVVVAVPLTVKTRDLLGEKEFSALRPNCIIVNVARGAIINERALYDFLKTHPDAKAAIDVWWRYPKNRGKEDEIFEQDYPFGSLPNIRLSPHWSDGVHEFVKLGSNNAVDNIIRYLRNEPLKGVANREDYIGLQKGH
jgi:phosphoglycerate dehydrogenase-like enzyme